MGVDTFGQPMADRAQLDDAFETTKSLFDDVLVKVKREHLVQRQRTSAEQAGVTIELFGRSQLGGPQMASGIEEPLQAGFDALALGQKFLGIENLVAQKLLAQGQCIKPGLERFFDSRGHLRTAQLTAAEEFDGYSCLFCTRSLPLDQMLSLYFNKDIIEKAFRSLKGIIQLRPIRHWLAERVHAHVFLCYLAYLLLSLLQYRLRKTDFTAESALRELSTMYKVYLRDAKNRFHLSRVVTLTKKQELILKAIDNALLKT